MVQWLLGEAFVDPGIPIGGILISLGEKAVDNDHRAATSWPYLADGKVTDFTEVSVAYNRSLVGT
jgi:hypothetical protein